MSGSPTGKSEFLRRLEARGEDKARGVQMHPTLSSYHAWTLRQLTPFIAPTAVGVLNAIVQQWMAQNAKLLKACGASPKDYQDARLREFLEADKEEE